MFDFRFGRKLPMTCKERMKHLEKLKTYFRTRFTREYLAELSEKHFSSRTGRAVRQPKLGDIVLVNDRGTSKIPIPRTRWNLGRIVALHPGRDGTVRSVDVHMIVNKGEDPCVLQHKSPRQLVPLEVDE